MKPLSSLLVFVEDTAAGAARLELACDLADRFDATVLGVCASDPVPAMYDPLGGLGEVVAALRAAAEDDLKRAKARFQSIVGARGVRSEWREALSAPASFLAREARSADLVVLGPATDQAPSQAPDPADVLMAVGRPILVVPEGYDGSCLDGTAIVAWKDTREARRAVSGALPLLAEALAVHVVEIAARTEADAAAFRTEDVARYLVRRDIPAEPRVILDEGQTTWGRLCAEARERDAQLIVAGGYGHGRLREWALGGVTRALLERQDVCVLLAH